MADAALKKAKQMRNGHRLHAKKLMDKANGDLKGSATVIEDTQSLLSSIVAKQKILEKLDCDILEKLVNDDEILLEIENASEHTDKIIEVQTKLELSVEFLKQKMMEDVKPKIVVEPRNDNPIVITKTPTPKHTKLPELKIPKFNGSLLDWRRFWNQFEANIDKREDFPEVQKLTYLQTYLEGDAERAIRGYATTAENYKKAKETLEARFGNKQARISAHMKELRSLKSVCDISDVSGMREMFDTLEFNITNLKELEVDVETYGSLLIAMLYDRIPEEIQVKIAEEFGDKDWNLEKSLEIMKNQLEARERTLAVRGAKQDAEDGYFSTQSLQTSAMERRQNNFGNSRYFNGNQQGNGNFNRNRNNRGKGDYRSNSNRSNAFQQNSRGAHNSHNFNNSNARVTVCVFCKGSHLASRCNVVTDINVRFDIVKKEQLCFVCLKAGHNSRVCRLNYSCIKCQRRHNIALCGHNNDDQRKNINDVRQVQNNIAQTTTNQLDNDEIVIRHGDGDAIVHVPEQIQPTPTTIAVGRTNENNEILLQSALAIVSSPEENTSDETCLLFDSCSHRTYVTFDLKRRLCLPTVRSEKLILNTFSSKQGCLKVLDVVQLCVKGRNGINVYAEALCVPYICSNLKVPSIDGLKGEYGFLRDLELAFPPSVEDKVEVLVGLDYYFSFISGKTRRGPPGGPVAVDSILGWLVCGPTQNYCAGSELLTNVVQVGEELEDFHSDSDLKSQLKDFWKVEEVSVDEVGEVADIVHENFYDDTYFNGRRYVTSLPFKPDVEFVPDNYKICYRRLLGLITNLNKDAQLKEDYIKVFESYEKEGIISRCHDSGLPGHVHYLPHRPVVRSDKETTKVRPVFDASAKEKGGMSLNDCLYAGPSLLRRIFDIIIRFCFKPIAVIADIKQAFLNIEIREEHRDFLRFLFIDRDDSIVKMRFNRGIFGVKSIPFLMCATIQLHMKSEKENNQHLSQLIEQFLRDLYMDDVATSVDTVKKGVEFYEFANKSMENAGLQLRKWFSNSGELRQAMGVSEVEGGGKKVLGLNWGENDDIKFDLGEIVKFSKGLPLTKRSILRIGAKFFDPTGFISPIVVVAKMYYQKCCIDELKFDDKLADELAEGWENFLGKLEKMNIIRFPRYFFNSIPGNITNVRLHGFCDASNDAYCAIVYAVCTVYEENISRFITSKTKVAPIKKLSIPRLELLSCLLLAELMHGVCRVLKDVVIVDKKLYWSDSSVALAWIKGTGKEAGEIWVKNRASKIRELTKSEDGSLTWYHVSTKQNPADIGTREESAVKFNENLLWREGPSFLKQKEIPEIESIQTLLATAEEDEEVEEVEKKEEIVKKGICGEMSVERFGDLSKLLRVTSYVMRFGTPVSKRKDTGVIKCHEIEFGKLLWVKGDQSSLEGSKNFKNLKKQLSLFQDELGFWRLKGRLENSHLSYDKKHPIFLDRHSYFTKLMILDAHERVKHLRTKSTLNELRSKFWISCPKQTINRVIKGCVLCKEVIGTPIVGPAPPDLPEYRVTYEFAFTNVGIDHAGPLFVKDIYANNNIMHKAYICLLTCAATRSVHIELSPDLTAPAVIRCLQRFIGRRGKFNMAVSDNFKSFVSKELQQFLTRTGIEWTHILPKSPWWGAFYERLIRIIKESLKKCVGKARLTYEEMETVLVEIEMIINSRPLTYLYDDEEGDEALTPSHMVMGRRLLTDVEKEPSTVVHSSENMNARFKYLQTVINHYWKRFSNEYLLELHQHHIHASKRNYDNYCKLLLGDVVLIKDDALKRNVWKKGRVEKLIIGKDGKARGAVLRVYNDGKIGYLKRPLQRIVPLEVQREKIDVDEVDVDAHEVDECEEEVPSVAPSVVNSPPCTDNVSTRGRKRFQTEKFQVQH